MAKLPKPGDRVEVEWEDSARIVHPWQSSKEAKKLQPVVVVSVGFVVKASKRRLVLADGKIKSNGDVYGVNVIPMGSVLAIRALRAK